MVLYRGADAVPPKFGPSAVTIGKFDGVHRGHRAVIDQLVARAGERDLVPTVITFDRNPMAVLAPFDSPDPVVSIRQRAELLELAGIDTVIELPFDARFAGQTPEEFVDRILVAIAHAQLVLVGEDFRFGAGGSGDIALLRELGETAGFDTVIIDDVTVDDPDKSHEERRASSTLVRSLLDEGLVDRAAAVLGRLPVVRGTVVHGEQRGRSLGYPTANLSREHEGYLPRDGVYATWVTVDGERYGAAVSIGNNPTFEGVPEKQLEAHLLDQSRDLYDREVEVAFVEYIRPMHRFPDADALVAQMHADEARIRSILGYPAAP